MTALLSTLISKDKSDGEGKKTKVDHVHYAAHLLKLALDKWATSVNQLKLQTLKALREYLNDPKRSVTCQFGALYALLVLGPEVLKECVLPQMDRYLTSLGSKLNETIKC